jgi:hypothetical protein
MTHSGRTWLDRLAARLARPLFGTRVIPADARVDPSLFPQEEFPIYCRNCDYLLRGLPDGPCPECGTPFERGRALVVTYVDDPLWRTWRYTRAGRLFVRLAIGSLLVGAASYSGVLLYALWADLLSRRKVPVPPAVVNAPYVMHAIMYVVQLLVLLSLVGCGLAVYANYRSLAARRRRIIDAIFTPSSCSKDE